jgi:YesN/AraC family two-component response regulator
MLRSIAGWKDKVAPRSYFLKLFSLISLVVALIVVILAYALFGKFSQYSEKALQSNQAAILSQISYNIRHTSEYVNQLLPGMYNNWQEVIQLLYHAEDDVPLTYENIIRLDQTVTSDPFIDSVYIYNGTLKQFYVFGTERFVRNQADFGDKEASEWVTHPGLMQPNKPVYRQIVSATGNQTRAVFTYVLYDSIDYRDTIPRMIVVNVKADWMMSNINNMSRNQFGPDSLVYIRDSAGHIVTANPGRNTPGQELLSESCLAFITGTAAVGVSHCRIGQTDYLAAYQSIPELNWRLLALSTNHFINTKIYEMRTATIAFSCLLMVVGLLLTLLAARLLHGPIRRLETNVSALFEGGRSGFASEFNYVNQALTQIKEDLTQLQSFKARHLLTLKHDLLKKLLEQPVKEEQQLEPILRQLNIALPVEGRYVVVLILIDRLAESKTAAGQEWERKRQELAGMLKNAFADPNMNEVIELEDQWVVLLETTPGTTPTTTGNTQAVLTDELRVLGRQAKERLGLSVSMFVSPKGNGLPSIRTLYKDAEYLSQYRLHYGQGCILTDEDVQGKIEDHMPFPTVVAKQLRNCLVHGEEAEANRLLADLLRYFSAYSIQNVKFGMIYLLHQIYETIGMMDANSSVTFDLDLIDINDRLNGCETLQEAEQLFRQLFDSVAAKLHGRKEDKSSQWADQMRVYIDEHLTDFNLSPSQIATLLRMSTDYVRKLFKKEMGISMAAYINQERVKLLAKQLTESDETIDSLLGAMGWDNKNYFYKLFKDHYGVTPTEYRLAKGDSRKLIR